MSFRQYLNVLRTQVPRRTATPSLRSFSSSALARNIQPAAPIPDTPTPAPAALAAAPPKKELSIPKQLALLPDGAVKSLYHYAQCYHCGLLGHLVSACPRKDKAPVCHRCRQAGHKATQCPEPRLTPAQMRTALHKSGAFEARFKGETPRDVVKRLAKLEAAKSAEGSTAPSDAAKPNETANPQTETAKRRTERKPKSETAKPKVSAST